MKKLFISQPMSGKADEEILAERKVAIKAAEELLREPVEVIDSFFQFCFKYCIITHCLHPHSIFGSVFLLYRSGCLKTLQVSFLLQYPAKVSSSEFSPVQFF